MLEIKKQYIIIIPILLFSYFFLSGQEPGFISGNSDFIIHNQGKYLVLESCLSSHLTLYPDIDYVLTEKYRFKKEARYVFEKEGKYGIIDSSGQVTDTTLYDYFSNKTCAGLYFAFNSGKWTVFDENLNKITNDKYDDVFFYKKKNIFLYKKNNKWGIYNIVNPNNSKPEYDFLKVINDDLLYYKKRKKYGIISMTGKDIYHTKVPVKINYNKSLIYIKNDEENGVIFKDSILLKPIYKSIKAYKLKQDKYVFLVKKGNKWYVYYNKEKITPIGNLTSFKDVKMPNGFTKYKVDGKWGFIRHINGEFRIFAPFYDDIADARYIYLSLTKSKYLKVKKNNSWGLIDKDNNFVVDYLYDEIYRYNDNYFFVIKNGKWGTINNKGEEIISTEYDYLKYHNKNLIYFEKDKKFGLLTFDNKVIFESDSEFKFERAKDQNKLQPGYIYMGDKVGVVDTNNLLILKPVYDEIKAISTDNGVGFLIEKDGEYGLFYNNKFIVNIGDIELYKRGGFHTVYRTDYFIFKKNNKYGIVSKQDQKLVKSGNLYEKLVQQEDIVQGYKRTKKPLIAKKDGKWGLIDYKENTITEFIFDEIKPFNKKIYIFKKDDKWGLMGLSGDIICEMIFSKLSKATKKYLISELNGKYGLIDTKGEIILKTKFDKIEIIDHVNKYKTYAIVKKDNKYGLIYLDYFRIPGIKTQNNLERLVLENNPEAVYSTINIRGETTIPIENENLFYFMYFPTHNKKYDYFITNNKDKYVIFNEYGEKIPQTDYKITKDKMNENYRIIFNNKDIFTIDKSGKIISRK